MYGRVEYRLWLQSLTEAELYEATRRVLTVELLEHRELSAVDDCWQEFVRRQRCDFWFQALTAARAKLRSHVEANALALQQLRERGHGQQTDCGAAE